MRLLKEQPWTDWAKVWPWYHATSQLNLLSRLLFISHYPALQLQRTNF